MSPIVVETEKDVLPNLEIGEDFLEDEDDSPVVEEFLLAAEIEEESVPAPDVWEEEEDNTLSERSDDSDMTVVTDIEHGAPEGRFTSTRVPR